VDAVITRRPPPPARAPRVDATTPNATVVEREDVSPGIVRFRIRPDDGVPAFEPGQYLALGLEADGRPLQRPYSTASPRGETDALEFLVRLVPDGALTPRLWTLHAGDRMRVGRPKGLFTADGADPRRPVYVATGTGIAPLLSMLETRLREADDGPAGRRPIVIHGVARARDLAWRHRLEALAARGRIAYVPAVSRPTDAANSGWTGATGRVDALLPGVLASLGADPATTVAFICGNPGMTEAAGVALRGLGLPDEAVRSEAYWVSASTAGGAG
jgi:ferredoxin-NADP reductase